MLFRDTFGLGVETLDVRVVLIAHEVVLGKPGEMKWGHPLKGSLGVRRTV
ncbi:hypothetical protein Syun_025792 [Stephania yunnanensis]|uniref:Uncharacterized protein n=1 Tax=Stephania yunnanensis TaxID=152371 RepID=A0AAP0EXP2_9MAGN